MAKQKWIQKAIQHPGALKAAAAAAGKTITQYCASPNLSPLTKKRCTLAETLKDMHK